MSNLLFIAVSVISWLGYMAAIRMMQRRIKDLEGQLAAAAPTKTDTKGG